MPNRGCIVRYLSIVNNIPATTQMLLSDKWILLAGRKKTEVGKGEDWKEGREVSWPMTGNYNYRTAGLGLSWMARARPERQLQPGAENHWDIDREQATAGHFWGSGVAHFAG
jgi:hypothetical protein